MSRPHSEEAEKKATQDDSEGQPPDITCSGGFRLPSIAVIIGRQLGQEQDSGQ